MPNQLVREIRGDHGIPVGAYRSVAPGDTVFAIETFLDELAHLAKLDALQMRLALLGSQPRLRRVLGLAAARSDWAAPLPPDVGRGLASSAFQAGLRGDPKQPTWTAAVLQARVDRASGEVSVEKIVCAADCGIVVNPDGVRAQLEGSLVFGLSAALKKWGTVSNGAFDQIDFNDYHLIRMDEVPEIEVHVVESTEPPTGAGEPGVTLVARALSSATSPRPGRGCGACRSSRRAC
jgi:isoquinoline 1-oxidoreductase beta subunit